MISIQQMQYILSVNDNRHYQRASEACFVTQPTLSMQIKKAEDELGYLIFDRSTNPLTLTVFGEKLIVIIRDILVEIEKIPKLIKTMNEYYQSQYLFVHHLDLCNTHLTVDLYDYI